MDTGSNKTDIAVSVAKGIIGIAPIIGPLSCRSSERVNSQSAD